MSYLDKLKEMDESWGSTEAQKGGGQTVFVPPGSYQVKIESAKVHEIKKGKNAGSIGIGFRMRIIGGDKEGTVLSKFSSLTSEENIGYFKGDLNTLGIDTNFKFSKLDTKLEEVIDVCAEVGVAHSMSDGVKYQNVYFNKLVDSPGGFASSDEDEDEEDEEPKPRAKKSKKKASKKGKGRKAKKPEPEPEPEDEDSDDEWEDDPWEDDDDE